MRAKVGRPNGVISGFHYEPGDESITHLVHCGQQWVGPRFRIDWHRHAVWELYYQSSGKTVWEIEGGILRTVQENELLAVAPSRCHRLVKGDPQKNEFYYAAFEISDRLLRTADLTSIWSDSIEPKISSAERTLAPIQRLIQEALTLRGFHDQAIDQALSQLLLEASRLVIHDQSVETGSILHPIIVAVREAILSDPGRPWTLDTFASKHNRSAKYLSNLFKEQMNEGFQRFLTRQRINLACQLLRETSDSITDIAIQAGFSSSQHLSTAFRKIRDQSPRGYRLTCR